MARVLVLTLLIAGAFDVTQANACTCARAGAPCSAFWRMAAVFAGKVVAIRPIEGRPGMQAVQFAVEQRGRGIESDTVEMESMPQNGVNCGYTFTLGERYVVYAYSTPGGRLTTDMCSGTKRAAEAAADLAYLKEVAGKPRGVRVFGHVRRGEEDLLSFSPRDYGGVAGARVRVSGDRASREVTTTADGEYDFRDLPPGAYKVVVTPPKGFGLAGPPLPPQHHHPPPRAITLLNPFQCAEVWTRVRSDSQIIGVLLDADGRPADGEPVDLIAAANARRNDKEIPHVTARTESDGRFTFAFMAPGTYIVGLNLKAPPPPTTLDRRSYHPGVTDPARATVVTVEPGSRVRLAPFALPVWPAERRISGRVVWSDGLPAPDATLTITGARPEPVALDATGQFSVVLPYGAEFTITAHAARIVAGRRQTARSPYQRIGREDRDGSLTLVLKVPQ